MYNIITISYELNKISDERGYFLKTLMSDKFDINFNQLEIYVTNAKPGHSKGGHFHEKAKEWFTLLKGKCTLVLIDVKTLATSNIELDERNPKTIFVPPYVAHEFFNTGAEDFLLLAATDQLYQKQDTIAYEIKLENN
jgi:dTDP-4-dehydrorhamnose 3,5-epimerase-like enzyme